MTSGGIWNLPGTWRPNRTTALAATINNSTILALTSMLGIQANTVENIDTGAQLRLTALLLAANEIAANAPSTLFVKANLETPGEIDFTTDMDLDFDVFKDVNLVAPITFNATSSLNAIRHIVVESEWSISAASELIRFAEMMLDDLTIGFESSSGFSATSLIQTSLSGDMTSSCSLEMIHEYVSFNDPLNSLTGFSTYNTGSGVTAASSQAKWNGTSDGQSLSRYTQPATSSNQYIAGKIGTVSGNPTALIFHAEPTTNTTNPYYYSVSFQTNNIVLGSSYGRWTQNTITNIKTWSGTVSAGQLIEAWNIGDQFYVYKAGTLLGVQTVSSPRIGAGYLHQGFGMMRSSFTNSGQLDEWWGGDAEAYGKV